MRPTPRCVSSNHDDDAADHAGRAGGRIPADAAAAARASSRQSIDDTLVTPSAHMASAIVGFDIEPQLHDRSRLRRPLRPRHAGPPRPRDAAQPRPTRRRRRITSPRRRRSSAPRRRAGIASRLRRAAPTPGCRRWPTGRTSSPAAAGGGLTATQAITRAFMQNGPDWITALYDMDTVVLAGVQQVRPVRLLRRTVRFARGDQLHRPLELQRHERDAAAPLLGRRAVRHQLHAGEVRRHGIAGRARQRLRQLQQRRQHRLPDQLVRPGAELRHDRTSTSATRSTPTGWRNCRSARASGTPAAPATCSTP